MYHSYFPPLFCPLFPPPPLSPDMLPFGWIGEQGSSPPYHFSGLSQDELVTFMSYWVIWRSPLIYGGDLLVPDKFSLSLISNPRALQITDHSVNNAPHSVTATLLVWRADSDEWRQNGVSYVSVHNLVNRTTVTSVRVGDVRRPVQNGTECAVRDVWSGEERGRVSEIALSLRPHASGLLVLHDCTTSPEKWGVNLPKG